MIRLRRRGAFSTVFLATLLAGVVVASGIHAAWHAHVPHATVPEGAALHSADDDDGAASCSICRLAHQVSSIPILPDASARPFEPALPAAMVPAALTAVGIEPSRSPRAPPATGC